ncbi:MAG TPA: alpha/beta hydrolase domain-containing protein [Acidimicrobiales bacterium]|nr:alpha/beta hydrolase domain-containing protein [Acidimicrobiales bacterium]
MAPAVLAALAALAVLASSVATFVVTAVVPSAASVGAAVVPLAKASVPAATAQGPILPASGISFLGSTLFPLSQVGYEESEYFISGTATAYTSKTPLARDGKWHVTAASTAPYTTRVVVYRPINPKKFDGTVAVEWLNVTGGVDAAAAWLTGHAAMVRAGMAYVGVDAQAGGIYGVPGSVATADGAGGIKQTDPTRYAALTHPGDSYSYSIFEQAGEAVHTSGAKLLGGLAPKRVLAIGESQSAFYLTTYLDAVQPMSAGVYDGYLIYSRGGDGSDLSQSPQPTIATPNPTYIRTDLHVPVMLFETEADLLTLGYVSARQPPTSYIREWETAGTAHDDTYGLLYSRSDNLNGVADVEAFESMLNPPKDPIPGIVDCAAPINAGSHTYELRAAISAIENWVRTGNPPPESPRLEVNSSKTAFVTDANGNALGGIRAVQVVAPVAKLSGIGQPGSAPANAPGQQTTSQGSAVGAGVLCGIFGTTVPLSSAQLVALYPSHQAFVKKWDAAAAAEVHAGYLLSPDARTLDTVAAASKIGG